MDSCEQLLDQDALYQFDLAWRAEIGEHESPANWFEGEIFYNADAGLLDRLTAAEEEQ
jgi:hypothetical protein